MITIVDTGLNNLGSLSRAFRQVGVETRTTRAARDIHGASILVLPGVGAFGLAMDRLRSHDLVEPIRQHARDKRLPTIGICLGSQLLLDTSDEHGMSAGLGLIEGHVTKLSSGDPDALVPRLGWAEVEFERSHDYFEPNAEARPFYFAHSHHARCTDPGHVIATTGFGDSRIAAVIGHDNIVGCQFHPEKSQGAGLDLLNYLAKRALGHQGPKIVLNAS